MPKKGGMTIVENSKNELIPQRTIKGWRMCIDYRKHNKATKKDHFPLPFIDEMLERLAKHSTSVSLMVILVTIKYPSIPMVRARPRSHVPLEHMPTDECHLGYATHPSHSKGA